MLFAKNVQLLYLAIFIFLSSCENTSSNRQTKYDSLTGVELRHLLNIAIRKKENKKYSGHYQYYSGGKQNILDGQFTFSFADSGRQATRASKEYEEWMGWTLKDKFSGTFKNNKKDGQFTEDFAINDNIDWGEEWKVTIVFENDLCQSATFKGHIGSAMPDTSYHFQSLDTCSFERVVNLAWKEWTKEYKRRKNAL